MDKYTINTTILITSMYPYIKPVVSNRAPVDLITEGGSIKFNSLQELNKQSNQRILYKMILDHAECDHPIATYEWKTNS